MSRMYICKCFYRFQFNDYLILYTYIYPVATIKFNFLLY